MKAGEMQINYKAISSQGLGHLPQLFTKGSKYRITAETEATVELLARDGVTRAWFTKTEVLVPEAKGATV